jgi:hypothetical protein
MIISIADTNHVACRVVFAQGNPRPWFPFDAQPAATVVRASYAACMNPH